MEELNYYLGVLKALEVAPAHAAISPRSCPDLTPISPRSPPQVTLCKDHRTGIQNPARFWNHLGSLEELYLPLSLLQARPLPRPETTPTSTTPTPHACARTALHLRPGPRP